MMKRRTKMQRWVMFVNDESKMDITWIHVIICFFMGHDPAAECHDPNHDACLWCFKSMPGKAARK